MLPTKRYAIKFVLFWNNWESRHWKWFVKCSRTKACYKQQFSNGTKLSKIDERVGRTCFTLDGLWRQEPTTTCLVYVKYWTQTGRGVAFQCATGSRSSLHWYDDRTSHYKWHFSDAEDPRQTCSKRPRGERRPKAKENLLAKIFCNALEKIQALWIMHVITGDGTWFFEYNLET